MVVDGSNLATEGRSTPSLAQLDEAVRAFHAERPDDEIIVVVDASFGYRIDESERKIFEEAEEAGEIVSPPAGAIGRGDGFLLRIADRIDADVLSNDSFQEFHGEYTWLFDEGRLVGGKPVPNVGWIFTPRTPVRGPKSRVATRDADRARRRAAAAEKAAPPEPTAAAIAEATAEAIAPEAPKSSRRGRRRRAGAGAEGGTAAEGGVGSEGGAGSGRGPQAINEPLPFITFIADHPLGTEVEGIVEGFTSHGAFVIAGGARCYAPVSGLGDPPPRSAKEVLAKGETRAFVIQALDPPRRGIELALPGLAKVAGAPTEETVEAVIDVGAQPLGDVEPEPEAEALLAKPRRRSRKAAPAAVGPVPEPAPVAAEPEAVEAAAKPRRSRKAAPAPTAEEPGADAPPAKPRRSRKVAPVPVEPAVDPAAEAEPAPATAEVAARPRRSTVRKSQAAPEVAVEPAPAKRARKKAAAPAVEPAPAKKAARSRKKVAVEPVAAEPAAVEVPAKKATRSRKKAPAAPEPETVEPAPVKAVKRATRKVAQAVSKES
ncbi:MAG TPA: hypothetical protein VM388_14535 [Acidimicrobiales bacterium]|nr:hypothetical protein [Acidimicrobiales bacterium]